MIRVWAALLVSALLLTASPTAAQEPDPTGIWEGRWRSKSEHHVEGGATPRQLRRKGSLQARFDFCVGSDGSITGSGTAKVTINASSTITRVFEDGTGTYKETFEPDEAEVPVKVAGERRGENLSLRLETGTVDLRQTATATLSNGQQMDWSNSLTVPAIGLLVIASSGRNPVATEITIAAQDGAEQEASSFDVYHDSDAPTSGVAHYHTHVQIRRPRDAAHELPILLGQIFGSVSHSWDPVELYPSGERKLESILPELKAALDGSSGKLRCGRPAITVVIEGNPDDLFAEAVNRARRDQLKHWFRSRGVDVDRMDWQTAFGPADDVQVSLED